MHNDMPSAAECFNMLPVHKRIGRLFHGTPQTNLVRMLAYNHTGNALQIVSWHTCNLGCLAGT